MKKRKSKGGLLFLNKMPGGADRCLSFVRSFVRCRPVYSLLSAIKLNVGKSRILLCRCDHVLDSYMIARAMSTV